MKKIFRVTAMVLLLILETGLHSVQFNAQNLSSGVYFYHLRAPDVNQIKKMTLTK